MSLMFATLLRVEDHLINLRIEVADLSERINRLLGRDFHMSASLDALTAEVAQVKTVAASAVALVSGFAARLDAAIAAAKAGDDAAALDALAADLKTSIDPLAAAVVANTPAAPAVAG